MRHLPGHIICLLLFLASFSLRAQEYNAYSFNELYNWEESTIYDMVQDSSGYYWFGTSSGLVRFNGVTFAHFDHPNFDHEYSTLKVAPDGSIWHINFGGQLFRTQQEKTTLVLDLKSKGDFIMDYFFETESTLLVVMRESNAVFRYNLNNNSYQEIYRDANATALFVTQKSDGFSFFFKESNPNRIKQLHYSTSTGKTKEIRSWTIELTRNKPIMGIYGNQIYSVLATASDFSIFELGDTVKPIFHSDRATMTTINAFNVFEDRLVICTKQGVISLNKSGTVTNASFRRYFASKLFRDQENNLWVTTLNKGALIIPNEFASSQQLTADEIIYSITDPQGNLYFSDLDYRFFVSPPPYTEVTRIELPELALSRFAYNAADHCIYFDNASFRYNTETHRSEDFWTRMSFKSLAPIPGGAILSASSFVTFILADDSEMLLKIKEKYHLENGPIESNRIILSRKRAMHCAVEPSGNGFYVSHLDGLLYYSDKSADREVRIDGNPILVGGMASHGEGIWVVTKSNNLHFISKGSVQETHALPMEFKHIFSAKNNLYLFNRSSICRFDRKANTFHFIGANDGVLDEPILNAFSRNDTLFVVGTQHIQQIPVSSFESHTEPPRLFISHVTVNGREFSASSELLFESDQNSVTFHFHALSIRSRKQQKYFYRLKETGDDWLETTGDAPFAQFADLSPGNYTFEIKCCGPDGTCSKTLTVPFIIEPHFTQTWWFVLLIGLALALLSWLILRWRIRISSKQSELQQEKEILKKNLYKSKIAAIRSQMNPHFMFNALNTIQQFIIANEQEIASEYLADFADLMRRYLDQSKQESISLAEEIETLKIYLRLEQLRYGGELQYSIEFDPEIPLGETEIPVMMLQPFIENSIKHGLMHKEGEKKLSICFEHYASELRCIIEDNGVGRSASQKINAGKKVGHTSFATSALDERVELINQHFSQKLSIEIEDLHSGQTATGTRVIIKISEK